MDSLSDDERIVRIFDPDPTPNSFEEYREIVKELRARILRRRNISHLLSILNGVCEFLCDPSSMPDVVSREVDEVIASKNISLIGNVRQFELGVCVAAAVDSAVVGLRKPSEWTGWRPSEALAAGVWSAFSFVPTCIGRKLDALRRDAVTKARERVLVASSLAWERSDVNEVRQLDGGKVTLAAYKAALQSIKEWKHNADLDREEIRFLRWVIAERSEILNMPLKSLAGGDSCRDRGNRNRKAF